MKKILGLITARGGSKRIPRKNIKEFLGQPLLYWTIKTAKEAGVFDRLILSTDDQEIAELGRQFGVEVPFLRPAELAQDETGSFVVVKHALEFLSKKEQYEPEWIMLLEPTSPGRRPFHLREAVELALSKKEADSIVAVSVIPSHFSPFKALQRDKDGFLTRHQDGQTIRNLIHRNQDIPELYFINSSLYIFRTKNIFQPWPSLWGDKVLGYLMDSRYALDIDVPDDWLVAEAKFAKILEEEKNQSK